MGRVASLFLGIIGCAAFAACGGADGTQLFDDAGQPTQDATSPPDAGGKDGALETDGGTVQDAVVIDVTPDVPIKPADSNIHCGTSTCSAQTQVCCANFGTTTTYKCVSSLSDCTGTQQVPITCSSPDNCASQGNAGYICCASGQGPFNQNPTCQNFSTAAQVQCQATCDANSGEFEVGCNTTTQNCVDTSMTCITSQCTLPGLTICR